jgi:hypothetical protein
MLSINMTILGKVIIWVTNWIHIPAMSRLTIFSSFTLIIWKIQELLMLLWISWRIAFYRSADASWWKTAFFLLYFQLLFFYYLYRFSLYYYLLFLLIFLFFLVLLSYIRTYLKYVLKNFYKYIFFFFFLIFVFLYHNTLFLDNDLRNILCS